MHPTLWAPKGDGTRTACSSSIIGATAVHSTCTRPQLVILCQPNCPSRAELVMRMSKWLKRMFKRERNLFSEVDKIWVELVCVCSSLPIIGRSAVSDMIIKHFSIYFWWHLNCLLLFSIKKKYSNFDSILGPREELHKLSHRIDLLWVVPQWQYPAETDFEWWVELKISPTLNQNRLWLRTHDENSKMLKVAK